MNCTSHIAHRLSPEGNCHHCSGEQKKAFLSSFREFVSSCSRELVSLLALMTLFMLFPACSSFYGGSTSSTGDQDISAAPTEIAISGDVNTVAYHTVSFTNRGTQNYDVYNLAFVGNDCAAYSVFNILDADDNVLYEAGDDVAIVLEPGETISINLRFGPTSCDVTSYTTTFIIYYNEAEVSTSAAVSLVTSVTDNTPPATTCETVEKTYYDEYDNPTKRTLEPLANGQPYYLRVDQMNAYIQTTGAFAAYATKVSTNLYLDQIPDEDEFQPVYVPFSADTSGNLTISTIDSCVGFSMPTPITDTFFLGAGVDVTTAAAFAGTIDRTTNPGRFAVPNFVLRLTSYINSSNSLLQSTDGYFDVNIETDLTTGETESNSFIADIPEVTDDDGNPMLNISGDKLVGADVRHGTITLVGIGRFMQDSTTKMSNESVKAIIENEAYLFIQIQGLITQEVL